MAFIGFSCHSKDHKVKIFVLLIFINPIETTFNESERLLSLKAAKLFLKLKMKWKWQRRRFIPLKEIMKHNFHWKFFRWKFPALKTTSFVYSYIDSTKPEIRKLNPLKVKITNLLQQLKIYVLIEFFAFIASTLNLCLINLN